LEEGPGRALLLPVRVVPPGDAVLLSRADYDALEETAHLLRVPANAKRLVERLQQALSVQREEHAIVR
jgi:antitoxin YefM